MPPTLIPFSRFRSVAALAVCACVLLSACKTTSKDDASVQNPDYRTIQADPLRDTDAAVKANAQGLTHLDAGELYQAEQAFKRALEANIDFGPAHNNLGKIYFLKRDFYRAAHEFDHAIKLMPKAAAPQNNVGLTLLEAGELDDAVDYFRKAVTLAPGEIQYQANLVRTLVERGDRTEEVMTLLRVVAVHDDRVSWRVWASHQIAAFETPR